MLTYGPQIMLSFAVDEPSSCGSLSPQSQPQLTEAQKLKAIESYALIAASHAVSVQKTMTECLYARKSAPSNYKQQSQSQKPESPQHQNPNSSLGLSMRLQDTFRNYLRMRMPNQINLPPQTERHRPSQELRQMFTDQLIER